MRQPSDGVAILEKRRSSMGLDLTPRDYLEMLREEYQEYQDHWHDHDYRVSMRKAINCCALSNALPEIITAHKNPTDPPKVLKNKTTAYRRYLQTQCKAHHTVRDIRALGRAPARTRARVRCRRWATPAARQLTGKRAEVGNG